MAESIWTAYADRTPTKEDADVDGFVTIACENGTIDVDMWSADNSKMLSPGVAWARSADVLAATGYVKPRKLHSAWLELREDSWKGARSVWLYDATTKRPDCVKVWRIADTEARHAAPHATHWQPCDQPPVWEDET